MTESGRPSVDIIRFSTRTWIGIAGALAVHAGSILYWGVSMEVRTRTLEQGQTAMRTAQERTLQILDKIEDRMYQSKK